MTHHNDLPGLSPVQAYTPPQLPTFREAPPAQLKKLPSRWAKNAAVVACVGILGAATLAGNFASAAGAQNISAPYSVTYMARQSAPAAVTPSEVAAAYTGYDEFDLNVRFHGGGAGSAMYVVHLTEAEAMNLIRTQLEAAGLNLGATPPTSRVRMLSLGLVHQPFTLPRPYLRLNRFNFDLYDSARSVAVTHINQENHWPSTAQLVRRAQRRFRWRLFGPSTVGVFYNPSQAFWRSWFPGDPTLEEQKAEAAQALVANLNAQTQQFIAFLQAEGIL